MKYDITHALQELRPNTSWVLVGDDYSKIVWNGPVTPPTEEELLAKVAEMEAREPLRLLRRERDKRLTEVDWIVTKSISTGEPLSQEWKDYMQALRDLPENSTPQTDESGKLDMNSVTWPIKPA